MDKANAFQHRFGSKTYTIARFVPIVRTFAPFVAGMGRMTYRRFMAYNVVGGITWIAIFVVGGYSFGNIPSVKKNFTLVMIGIVFVSVLPPAIEILREWAKVRRLRCESKKCDKIEQRVA